MTDIEQQARELLAAECEKVGFTEAADRVRIADFTGDAGVGYEIAIQAIAAALASQPQALAVPDDVQRNAARYLFLRSLSVEASHSDGLDVVLWVGDYGACPRGEDLDAEIDAWAMRAAVQQAEGEH